MVPILTDHPGLAYDHFHRMQARYRGDGDRHFALPLLFGLALTAPFWGRRCCPPRFYPYPVPRPFPYLYPYYPSPYFFYHRRPYIYY